MSIAILSQVYEEVRRLAIAGSVVAPGDFRLKKLIAPLEQAGSKAPVFAKIAEATQKLVDCNEKTSAVALLELSTLVSAVMATQAETGVAGELQPVASTDLGLAKTQTSARVLKPLLVALTSTGSGRLEIIREAVEQQAFRDLRLVAPALAALDDSYAEIGELIATQVLPLYGKAILPELRETFQIKGKGGHIRRLQLMHTLDPAGSQTLVRDCLEQGSKELRVAAIGCLGSNPEDLPFLLEQSKAKSKEVRAAALAGLSASPEHSATEVLCKVIAGKDLELAIEPLRTSEQPAVRTALLEAVQTQVAELFTGKLKDKSQIKAAVERAMLLLQCFRGRTDTASEQLLLSVFVQSERLLQIKGDVSGKDLLERLIAIMVVGSPKVQAALVDAHAALPAESLGEAFVAACRSRPANEVFQLFSPYVAADVDEKKRARDPAYAKREALIERIVKGRLGWGFDGGATEDRFDLVKSLAPQWLDLAVERSHVGLVLALAMPGHAPAMALLSTLWAERLAKSKNVHEMGDLLSVMIRVKHPQATDAMIAVIERYAKSTHFYYFNWLARLIVQLPKAEAVPKFEALLSKLPEKIVDQIIEYVVELKQS